MMQYSNAFGVAIDDDGEEVVITFKQNIPDFKSDQEDHNPPCDIVSIVMCTAAARALCDSLEGIITNTDKKKADASKI